MKALDKIHDQHLQRQEMKQIAQIIKQDYIVAKTVPHENFSDYLRSNSEQRDHRRRRDPARDFWRSFFELHIKEKGVDIYSRGPDRKKNTKDDIIVSLKLEEFVPPLTAPNNMTNSGPTRSDNDFKKKRKQKKKKRKKSFKYYFNGSLNG